MASLTIGRVGLDVTLEHPYSWDSSGRSDRVRGYITDSTVANRNAIRSELVEQVGRLVAVTWTKDTTRDGFYIVRSASVRSDVNRKSFETDGLMEFTVDLDRIGSVGSVELQSLITGTVVANDFGVITTETKPFHAPSVGALTYDSGSGAPTVIERTTSDGAITVFEDITDTENPTWSVSPSTYYSGAAQIKVSSLLRSGLDAPNDPEDFELSNGLVRLKPGTTASVSDGTLEVEWYDGSAWDTAKVFYLTHATVQIPRWHYITILRNTPEECRIRLVRDAAESPPTSYRHILDISLRRGSRFLACYYTWTNTAIDMQIRVETNEASTAVTPTGATGTFGIRATSNDASGNRFVLACPKTQTQDLTNGRITQAATTTFPFMIGSEVGGSGAASGDQAADLMLQYLGWVSETVRAVRR